MIRIADNGNVYYKKSDLDDDIFVVKYDSNKWKIRDEDSDCRWIPKNSTSRIIYQNLGGNFSNKNMFY